MPEATSPMHDAASQELLKKGIAAAKAARQKPASPEQTERRRRQARSLLALSRTLRHLRMRTVQVYNFRCAPITQDATGKTRLNFGTNPLWWLI